MKNPEKQMPVKSDVSRRFFLRSLGIGAAGTVVFNNTYAKWLTAGLVSPAVNNAPAAKLHYYAYDAVLDTHGVIAPWYNQQNGQCDYRIRIAAETLKRYPWTTTENAIAQYPHYLFSGKWKISNDGAIDPQDPGDWLNGDLGQRSVNVLKGMADYYRYTGDAAAIAHITYMGDFMLDHCLTPPNHNWPNFPVSVPCMGKPYYNTNPHGMIQLDICASMGQALLKGYQITGKKRWFDAARHWGDLFAEKCNITPGEQPWGRYANPEDAFTEDHGRNKRWRVEPRKNLQTGGVTMVISFLDELIRMGYTGKNNKLVKARKAGLDYFKNELLPKWTQDDTFALYFWDWLNIVQNCTTTADVAIFMMNNKADFPNWKNDVRNILTIFLNRTSANPESFGDIYNGAWAYPESSDCCKTSTWYAPLTMAPVFVRYGVEADNDWMRELGYRQMILQTYDAHNNGVTEDLLRGGIYVNATWFNIAHPWPLLWVQNSISWLPVELGASKENHVVNCSATVNSINYGKGDIKFSVYSAPENTYSTLRLSFVPVSVTANGQKLHLRNNMSLNGYTIKQLPNGDAIVHIRHDGLKHIQLKGPDAQKLITGAGLSFDKHWQKRQDVSALFKTLAATATGGAVFETGFNGNQVRLIGRYDEYGGIADVFIDGEKQLVAVDCYNPTVRSQQTLYYKNGLANGNHTIKVVARGAANPYAKGSFIYIDHVQACAEDKAFNYPTGTGPKGFQRMIFGYPGRNDYKDAAGNVWRPATEIVTRVGATTDTVEKCWLREPVKESINNTPDQELYRYGYHAAEFWVNLTVGPGEYDVCLKFAATRGMGVKNNSFDILINNNPVVEKFDMLSTAGGVNTAANLIFKKIKPLNGAIVIKLKANDMAKGKAFIQALELGPVINKTSAKIISYTS